MLGLVVWSLLGLAGVVGAVVSANRLRFGRHVAREMRALEEVVAARPARPIDRAHVATLPPPVRRWAEVALAGRETLPRSARVVQRGSFRTSFDGAWLQLAGEQLFTFDPPAFVWWGRVKMAPGIWVDARDRWADGQGHMLVKAASTITLADAGGAEIDESAMHRLLGEMAWFVAPMLDGRYVRWTPVDARSAEATLQVGAARVSARFEFGDDGLPSRFVAERWRDVGGGRAVKTPFTGTSTGAVEAGGVVVPREVRAAWHVDGQDREYGRFVLTSVELDPPR